METEANGVNVWAIVLGIIWGFEMCQVFLVPAPAWGKELPAFIGVLVTIGLVRILWKKKNLEQ